MTGPDSQTPVCRQFGPTWTSRGCLREGRVGGIHLSLTQGRLPGGLYSGPQRIYAERWQILTRLWKKCDLTSDGVAGKPELCDYGWMGAHQRLLRAETLFRGGHNPLRRPVPCTLRGEQVCRPAPTAERRFGSCLGCGAGPALVLGRATASARSASQHWGRRAPHFL